MKRRILLLVALVALLAVVVFGIPLGLAVARLYRDQEVISLERQATLAGLQVSSLAPAAPGSSVTPDPVELPLLALPRLLGLYDTGGHLVAGVGPPLADPPIRRALLGGVADSLEAGQIVVGVPLSSGEQVFAALRASVPQSVVRDRTHRTWAAMAGLGLVAVALAVGLGLYQSRRLAGAVTNLAGAAHRLGMGDFTVDPGISGIGEIDEVGATLRGAATRLGGVIERERAFSADASHQLRTPITALRLTLENAVTTPGIDPRQAIDEAMTQLDRLQATVEDLLALARGLPGEQPTVNLADLLEEVRAAWHARFATASRPLRIDAEEGLPPGRMAPPAVQQVLDVLLDNALRHGAGAVSIQARRMDGGLAVDVCDQGQGIAGDPATIFRRGTGSGHGIGLSLARSLAEAQGARLRLQEAGPGPVFVLLMAAAASDVGGPPHAA